MLPRRSSQRKDSHLSSTCQKRLCLRGRSSLHQTHNVAMVSPIAAYVVALGTDGHIASQGTVSEAMLKSGEMQKEEEESEEAIKKADQEADTEGNPEEAKPKSDGKLIVAEEIAEGHVSWYAGEFYRCFRLVTDLSKGFDSKALPFQPGRAYLLVHLPRGHTSCRPCECR